MKDNLRVERLSSDLSAIELWV